jgi:hypothetical protein
MPRALVVSDNPSMAYAVETEFSAAGWASNSTSVHTLTEGFIADTKWYDCMVLIVDLDFLKRKDLSIDKITLSIGEISRQVPIYLIFEGDYNPILANWIEYTKRIFKMAFRHFNLWNAVQKVVKLESKPDTNSAFFSPMDSI